MNKKVKTISDKFFESLTPKQAKKYKDDYKKFALSELILALMEEDDISVRELAKIADVSPAVVQSMRTNKEKDFTMRSFFKILKGLGVNHFMVEVNGKYISLDIPTKK